MTFELVGLMKTWLPPISPPKALSRIVQVWELANSATPLVCNAANADSVLVGAEATELTWLIARLPLRFVQALVVVFSRHRPPSLPKSRLPLRSGTMLCCETWGPTLLVD